MLGCGSEGPQFKSQSRIFFSLKFLLKRKWTKWWTTRRGRTTTTTQVIPWSLADGRRQSWFWHQWRISFKSHLYFSDDGGIRRRSFQCDRYESIHPSDVERRTGVTRGWIFDGAVDCRQVWIRRWLNLRFWLTSY